MSDETVVPKSIDELSAQSFDQFLDRIRYSLGRASSHGSGKFLLAMLCTVALIASLRIAIPSWLNYQENQISSMDFLFRAEIQSPSGNPVRPIVGAVTDATEASSNEGNKAKGARGDLLDCGPMLDRCEGLLQGRDAVQTFSEFVTKIVDLCAGRTEAIDTGSLLKLSSLISQAETDSRPLSEIHNSCRQEVAEIVGEYRDTGLLQPLYLRTALLVAGAHMESEGWREEAERFIAPCRPSADEGSNTRDHEIRANLLPEAQCDTDSGLDLQTLIPRQMSPSEDEKNTRRTLEGILSSHVLDYVVSRIKVGPALPSVANEIRPELVQAYFISQDNVLRIWNRAKLDQANALPRTRLWSASKYFTQLLNTHDKKSVTRTYLDVGGNGLVRTYCYPLDTVRSKGGARWENLDRATCRGAGFAIGV